jgi:hypothetical protein
MRNRQTNEEAVKRTMPPERGSVHRGCYGAWEAAEVKHLNNSILRFVVEKGEIWFTGESADIGPSTGFQKRTPALTILRMLGSSSLLMLPRKSALLEMPNFKTLDDGFAVLGIPSTALTQPRHNQVSREVLVASCTSTLSNIHAQLWDQAT